MEIFMKLQKRSILNDSNYLNKPDLLQLFGQLHTAAQAECDSNLEVMLLNLDVMLLNVVVVTVTHLTDSFQCTVCRLDYYYYYCYCKKLFHCFL